MDVCPCCGFPIAPVGVLASLTVIQRRLFIALQTAGTAGLTREQAFDLIYGNRADGGPLYLGGLNVQKFRMKAALASFGLEIHSTHGSGARWTLRAVSPSEAPREPAPIETRASREPALRG